MRYLYNSLMVCALLLLAPGLTWALTDEEMSRTIKESYAAGESPNLEVINKYGDIIMHTWDKDSISVEVTITAHGKKPEVLRKQIDRVEVEIRQTGEYIRMETLLDRKSGSLNEFFKSIGDGSKALLNKNKLEINWVVYLPKRTEIIMQNKFGDVYMEAVYGKTRMNISNGKLRADGFHGYTRLNLAYADADIAYLNEAYLELKVSEIDIRKAENLTVSGNSSEYFIKEVGNLKLDSRNNDIIIGKVQSVTGTTSFTKLNVEVLRQYVDAEMKYGEIEIDQVINGFSKIRLRTNSTDVKLGLDANAGFEYDITVREDRFTLPPELKEGDRSYVDSKEKYINSRGKTGKVGSPLARVIINADGGTVELTSTPVSTTDVR